MKSMAKLIGRIAVILAAAAIVVGATSLALPALTQSPSFARGEGRPGGFEQRRPRSDQAEGQRGDFNRAAMPGGRGGEYSINLFGGMDVLGNLAKMALVILPFAVVGFIQRRRKLRAARARAA